MKGGKPGLNVRRKGALARLEATYAAFKKAGKDKEIKGNHEVARMEREMTTLKSRIYN